LRRQRAGMFGLLPSRRRAFAADASGRGCLRAARFAWQRHGWARDALQTWRSSFVLLAPGVRYSRSVPPTPAALLPTPVLSLAFHLIYCHGRRDAAGDDDAAALLLLYVASMRTALLERPHPPPQPSLKHVCYTRRFFALSGAGHPPALTACAAPRPPPCHPPLQRETPPFPACDGVWCVAPVLYSRRSGRTADGCGAAAFVKGRTGFADGTLTAGFCCWRSGMKEPSTAPHACPSLPLLARISAPLSMPLAHSFIAACASSIFMPCAYII